MFATLIRGFFGRRSPRFLSAASAKGAYGSSLKSLRRMGTQASMNRQVRHKFIDGRILRKALAAMELDSSPGKH